MASLNYDQRVMNGAGRAGYSVAILFGAWRLAVAFDQGASVLEWFWLVVQAFLLVCTAFIVIFPHILLGQWLIDNDRAKRWQAALGGVAIAFVYGWLLLLTGWFGMRETGAFGVPFLNYLVLLATGAIGGIVAHKEWFPQATTDEAAEEAAGN